LARQLGDKDTDKWQKLIQEKWQQLLDEQQRIREQQAAGSPEAMPPGAAPSTATRLVLLAQGAAALLTHAPTGQAHLTVTREGRGEPWPIRSGAVRSWLKLAYFKALGRSAGSQAVEDALGVLEGMALCEGAEKAVHVRIAGAGERSYLDLADAERHV